MWVLVHFVKNLFRVTNDPNRSRSIYRRRDLIGGRRRILSGLLNLLGTLRITGKLSSYRVTSWGNNAYTRNAAAKGGTKFSGGEVVEGWFTHRQKTQVDDDEGRKMGRQTPRRIKDSETSLIKVSWQIFTAGKFILLIRERKREKERK